MDAFKEALIYLTC